MEICASVRKYADYLKNVRRKLHSLAELSGSEDNTRKFICSELKSFGIKYRIVEGGVVADIFAADRTNHIGIRADMDALPIKETVDTGFNAHGEVMHACGHDGHMAMLLALAKMCAAETPDYSLRLIFQPAEEDGGGAAKMIEKGVADGLTEIYALHLSPDYPAGTLATDSGALFAGVVEFDIAFSGTAAHCAVREQGRDALRAAAGFLIKAQEIDAKYARNNLLHCGRICGGSARNIVAHECALGMTFRYFDVDDREAVMMEIARALVGIDNEYGTAHRLTVEAAYPPLINSAETVDIIRSLAEGTEIAKPQYTAEDFAFFCEVKPAAMCWLGVGDEKHRSPLHSDTFGFDEGALLYGLELYRRLMYK